MSKGKSKNIDINKSQVKGSHAHHQRGLNLFTSPTFSKKFRQLFSGFPEHNPRTQKPVWLSVGQKKIAQPDGIRFELSVS